MNQYFAHNGVNHANTTEAAAHQLSDILPVVALITFCVATFMAIAVWAAGRVSAQTVSIKNEDEE